MREEVESGLRLLAKIDLEIPTLETVVMREQLEPGLRLLAE